MTHSHDFTFSLPLGVLSGKREFLNFDRWVQARLAQASNCFAKALLNYLQENIVCPLREIQLKTSLQMNMPAEICIVQQSMMEQVMEKAQLKIEMMAIILEHFVINIEKMNAAIKSQIA